MTAGKLPMFALALALAIPASGALAEGLAYAAPDGIDATPIFGRTDVLDSATLGDAAYECRMEENGGVLCIFDKGGRYSICYGTGECLDTEDPAIALSIYRPADYERLIGNR